MLPKTKLMGSVFFFFGGIVRAKGLRLLFRAKAIRYFLFLGGLLGFGTCTCTKLGFVQVAGFRPIGKGLSIRFCERAPEIVCLILFLHVSMLITQIVNYTDLYRNRFVSLVLHDLLVLLYLLDPLLVLDLHFLL